jgi:ABC-type phosphate transport system substrate-binding protein
MRKRKTRIVRLSLVGVAAVTLPVVWAGVASADYAPQPNDIVGVGGDTPQFAVDFALNGDTSGALGFNATATVNRVVDFDATADGNARSAYTNSVTSGAPSVALNPTDVLRAGDVPVQRVQSSGAAITALLADTGTRETINYIFSASLPTPAQQTQAHTNGWTYLHVVEFGTDAVEIAADATTNAPAGLSAKDLVGIYKGTYTTWTQIPGNSGGSIATIIPELPPSGSSIYKTFTAALTAANTGTAVTFGGDVKTVEQNDPTAITGASIPANAIVPFSQARLNLWNDGYFHNPATVFPGAGSPLSPGISLLSGTVPGGGTVYSSAITDYIIFRQSDLADPTPLEPGGTRNWAKTLFSDSVGPKPYFELGSTQTLLAASGVTPDYVDLGDVT